MEDNNEDNLKNKEDLHIAGRHTALDKNENNPKEDDNLRWNMTFDDLHIAGRHTALEKNENDPKEEDDNRVYSTLPEKHVYDFSH